MELRCNRTLPFRSNSSSLLLLLLLWVCGQRVCVVQAKRHIHSSSCRFDGVDTGAPHDRVRCDRPRPRLAYLENPDMNAACGKAVANYEQAIANRFLGPA